MASLDDAIRDADRKSKQHKTQLDAVLEALSPEDAKKLLEVYLPDRRYSTPQICRALKAMGCEVGRWVISDWRAKNVPRRNDRRSRH